MYHDTTVQRNVSKCVNVGSDVQMKLFIISRVLMVGCYLQAVDQVLQLVDGSQCVVIISRHVSQDGPGLSVVADSLLDGGVDSGKMLDGGVSPSSAAIDLLIEP